jgi:uncharacterized membrane protein YraQ (UPF0718 family)
MIILYFILSLFNYSIVFSALSSFLNALQSILPFFVLVFFIIFFINLFLKPETIKSYLGKGAGLKGWIYTILGSILISSPPYVIFPLLGELKKHGMRNRFIAVFLNTRNVQIAFLPVMAHYFGWLFVAVITIYVLIYSILSGLILERMLID